MKYLNLVILLLVFFIHKSPLAQEYHSPAQIFKILTESKVIYNIGSLKTDLPDEKDEDLPLNQHGVYIGKNEAGQSVLKMYELSPDAMVYVRNGENYFQSGEMEKARTEYLNALETSPNNSQLMTFIGQTYGIDENYQKEEEWYKKAIKANYIDYLAHWFLADIYLIKADTKKTVEEITIAHVLNRNNPRLFQKLTIIYNEKGLRYTGWKFRPHYKMAKNDDNSISPEYDSEHPEWMMYMLCKAVWAHEPGYKKNMLKNAQEIPRLVEEKECLVNLVRLHIKLTRNQLKKLLIMY
jgi:tetratricopeptide (TPR) repeat protein